MLSEGRFIMAAHIIVTIVHKVTRPNWAIVSNNSSMLNLGTEIATAPLSPHPSPLILP